MTNEEKANVYAIVLFLPKKDTGNLIDLVPTSWIFTDDKGEILCKYPRPEEYKKLPHWVTILQTPLEEWECFYVEIISYARK